MKDVRSRFPTFRLTAEALPDHPGFEQALSRLRSGALFDFPATSPIIENRRYTLCDLGRETPSKHVPTNFLVRTAKRKEAETMARAFIVARWPDVEVVEFELLQRTDVGHARFLARRDMADWLWFPQPEPKHPDALEELLLG